MRIPKLQEIGWHLYPRSKHGSACPGRRGRRDSDVGTEVQIVKKVIGVLFVLLVVLPGSGASALAGAEDKRAEDNQRFLVAGRVEEPSATIAGNGVITGVGSLTAESVDFRPADNTYHETDVAVIGGGTLTMSIDGRFDPWPFTLDPRSCTQRGTLTGTWTVMTGSGDFVGATGDGTFSGRFVTYARRGPAGCDEETLKGFVVGPMVGNVSLPDA